VQKKLSPFYAFLLIPALVISGCSKAPENQPPRTIQVEMKKYTITPAEIRVKQGEAIDLEITSADTEHGFDVPELKISEPVKKGMPARVRLDTSRKGTFKVECGIICGARHDEMRAQVVIE